MSEALDREREHQDAWYARAVASRFFEREGFRRLIAWNLARLREVVPLTPASRVLSLGCGTGEYELALAPGVAHITAIDLSATAIAEAERRARTRGLVNMTWQVGSLLDTPHPPGSFDVIYALGVLHHLGPAERHLLLGRVHAWLVPGGCFYARDPNAGGVLRRATGWWFRHSSFHSPNEAALDPALVAADLRAAGFDAVMTGYTDVLGGPLPWLTASSSGALWSLVFAFDRAWLATPGLRRLASQFDVRARR